MQMPRLVRTSSRRDFRTTFRAAVNRITRKGGLRPGSSCRKASAWVSAKYANSSFPERAGGAGLWRDNSASSTRSSPNLIDFRVGSIDSLDRLALPEESLGQSPLLRRPEGARQRGAKNRKGSPAGIIRHALRSGLHRRAGQVARGVQCVAGSIPISFCSSATSALEEY